MQNRNNKNKKKIRLRSAMNISSNSLASSQGFVNQNLWNNFKEMNQKNSKCTLTKKVIENDQKAIDMIADNFKKQSDRLKNRINMIYDKNKNKKKEMYNSSSSPKFTEEYMKERNVDLINVDLK